MLVMSNSCRVPCPQRQGSLGFRAAWLLCFLATFAAPVFAGGGLERAVRRGLLVCGVLCLAGTVGPAVGNMRLQLVGVVGYAGVLPAVSLLLARLFAHQSE